MGFFVSAAIALASTIASSEIKNAAARKLAGQRDRDIQEGIRLQEEADREQQRNVLKALDKVDPDAQEDLQGFEDDKALRIFEDLASANKGTRTGGIEISGDGIKQSITPGDSGEGRRQSLSRNNALFSALGGTQNPITKELAFLNQGNRELSRQAKADMNIAQIRADGRRLDSGLMTLAGVADLAALVAGQHAAANFPGFGGATAPVGSGVGSFSGAGSGVAQAGNITTGAGGGLGISTTPAFGASRGLAPMGFENFLKPSNIKPGLF